MSMSRTLFSHWYSRTPRPILNIKSVIPEIKDLDPCGFVNEPKVDSFDKTHRHWIDTTADNSEAYNQTE